MHDLICRNVARALRCFASAMDESKLLVKQERFMAVLKVCHVCVCVCVYVCVCMYVCMYVKKTNLSKHLLPPLPPLPPLIAYVSMCRC
jgi:hypothetical protein